ncbi:Chaperone protein ClpB [Metakosakonia massiliensis]|uniref:Chaperone protein ClpB n=1 Tax=Phytobacter massiliensis TaxID=1485952 RepID=A0A6N3AKE3_9ENTR
MLRVDIPKLIARFHPISRQILEATAGVCVSRQASEITIAHYLLQCLDTPLCDVRMILERAGIELQEIRPLLEDQSSRQTSIQDTPTFSPLLVEWFQDALILSISELNQEDIRSGALLLALLHNPGRYISPAVHSLLLSINKDQAAAQFVEWTQGSAENNVDSTQAALSRPLQNDASLLAHYSTDVTAQARSGQLDPVLCRDKEIDLMIDILCRRRKNNPIIVGEAGVGKSALIEGLALRITDNDVPDKLKGTTLVTLDLAALQAGASVKGEFEKRFKGIMQEVKASPTPVILFIDEAHTLIGAGNQQGGWMYRIYSNLPWLEANSKLLPQQRGASTKNILKKMRHYRAVSS